VLAATASEVPGSQGEGGGPEGVRQAKYQQKALPSQTAGRDVAQVVSAMPTARSARCSTLDALSGGERTVVIVTADHGEPSGIAATPPRCLPVRRRRVRASVPRSRARHPGDDVVSLPIWHRRSSTSPGCRRSSSAEACSHRSDANPPTVGKIPRNERRSEHGSPARTVEVIMDGSESASSATW
jgi:hypothetical protein